MTADTRRARTAFLRVGVIAPLALIAVAAVIVAAWLPDLPDPAAVHWSGDGVDGFAPGWTFLVILVGLGGGLVGVFALLILSAHRPAASERGEGARRAEGTGGAPWSATSRFLGGVALGLAGLLSVVTLAAVAAQRGLTDAAQAPNVGGAAALSGAAVLVVLTAVGWFLQPKTISPDSLPGGALSADPLPATASERLVWIGTATIARAGILVLGGAVLVAAATIVLLFASGAADVWSVAVVLATFLLVVGALVVTFAFRVRIGPSGLRVRSLVGWPQVVIPTSEVAGVRATTVNPFADFGGWGLRHGLDGRSGVVLRAGEALEVTRTDGRRFVVTVDDAQTAASVLATAARTEG